MANSNHKTGFRPQMGQAGWILLLIFATVMTLLPLIFTLSLSFRTQNSIYDPRLFVTELTNGNYIKAMKDNPTIPYNFLASFVISTVSTAATVLFASMAVFGFSRENVKGKLLMYNMIMCALMVPISALVIPITQLNSRFGLLDNDPTGVHVGNPEGTGGGGHHRRLHHSGAVCADRASAAEIRYCGGVHLDVFDMLERIFPGPLYDDKGDHKDAAADRTAVQGRVQQSAGSSVCDPDYYYDPDDHFLYHCPKTVCKGYDIRSGKGLTAYVDI